MAIALTNLADKVEASVIVAQDGSGDYNGTTDVCIQDAIDSLDPDGGWIFIKPGDYTIDSTVNVEVDGITISGVKGSTNLGTDGDLTLLWNNAFGLSLDRLSFFYGGDLAGTDAQVFLDSGGSNVRVDDCRFSTSNYSGLHVEGNNTIIRNCSVDDCADVGIDFGSLWSSCINNDVNECENGGIRVDTIHALISGNLIFGVTGVGISVDGTYNRIIGNDVYEPNITRVLTYGIEEVSPGGDYNLINDNIVYHPLTEGYKITGAHTITGVNGDW